MLPIATAINFGPPEMLIAVVLIVLLFGATKIPELARSLGKAKAEYQKASAEGEREVAAQKDEEPEQSGEKLA